MGKAVTSSQDKLLNDLKNQLSDLQERVARLEGQIEYTAETGIRRRRADDEDDEREAGLITGLQNEVLESRIGEHGMAWLGNIVLFFGIIFLMQFFQNQGLKLASSLFGFGAVIGVYLLGNGLRKQYPVMSRLFVYNSYILLFYTFLRLHYVKNPVIGNSFLGLLLPLLSVVFLTYVAYHRKSQILALLTLIMGIVLAIFTNSTYVMLSMLALFALTALYFTFRLEWWTNLIISIFLVYFTYLIWLLGNPVISHKIEAISEHHYSYLFLFGYAFIYSMLALLKEKGKTTARLINSTIIINGLGFSMTTSLVVLSFLQEDYILFLGLITVFCLIYAAVLQWRGDWKLPPALYALYGFVVMRITISVYFTFPLAFFLLSLQSLLVVSLALWFRSRFIVIMNLILFVGLLITYLALREPIHIADFSFALTALLTARVINWKKMLLEIQTEFIRNIYLFAGFVMVLVSLYHAVPDAYKSLSWAGAAVLFFLLSVLLSNVKYRYLAIAALVATAFHLFLFDLKNIGIGYRVIALLFLAIISLGISLFYARRQKEKKPDLD